MTKCPLTRAVCLREVSIGGDSTVMFVNINKLFIEPVLCKGGVFYFFSQKKKNQKNAPNFSSFSMHWRFVFKCGSIFAFCLKVEFQRIWSNETVTTLNYERQTS